MSKFITSLTAFVAGASAVNTDIQAMEPGEDNPFANRLDPVNLRPLNLPGENLYAAHRSHSSHSSHRSSSGNYSAPSRTYSAPRSNYSSPSYGSSTGFSNPVDAGRPATVSPAHSDFDPTDKKLMEIIRRVQMALYIKGYDPGTIDGVMGSKTRSALMLFQVKNGLVADAHMGTPTLNALGVVAPQ